MPTHVRKKSIGLLVIQASPFCNIDCDYCYLPDRTVRSRMPLDALRVVLEKVLASGFVGDRLSIVWHAGEPLALPLQYYVDAFSIIDEAATAPGVEIAHSFQSNGIALNQQWCDFIKRRKIRLGLSIDGPAFIHDAHRKTRGGAGTHERVMRAIHLLRDNAIDFHAIAVVSDLSLDHADAFFAFFAEAGIQTLGLNIEEIEGVHRETSLATDGVPSRVRQFLERLFVLQKTSNGRVQIREFDRAYRAIATAPLGENAFRAAELNDQVTPYGIVSVDFQGNVSTFSPELLGATSDRFGRFSFGSLITGSLDDVAHNATFTSVHREITEGIGHCQDECEYFAFCGGGAPSNKYFENGSFASTESLYCRFTIKLPLQIVLGDLEASLITPSDAGRDSASKLTRPY